MPKTRRAWMGWLAAAVMAAFVFANIYLPVSRQRVLADLTEARSNLRSMSLAMYEFDASYGTFPNAETAKRVIPEGFQTIARGRGAIAPTTPGWTFS